MTDPLWVTFPRWLLYSGLPENTSEKHGLHVWLVLRACIERDCDRNLTPDWCSITQDEIARMTGVSMRDVDGAIETLLNETVIECRDRDQAVIQIRIVEPIKAPRSIEEIRSEMAEQHGLGGRHALRYSEDSSGLSKVEKVIFLYQMVFGLRFTPHIVEELEQMAGEYDLSLIYDIFSEANRRSGSTFAWVRSQVKKRAEVSADDVRMR